VAAVAAAAPRPTRARARRRRARSAAVRAWWTLRDYARRVWDNAGEDNIFFLAGGIAFNILLAAVPFALLLVTGLAYLLNQSAESSAQTVTQLIDRLLPGGYTAGRDLLHGALGEAVRTRGQVGFLSAIGFVWFSTRLFGSLRSVLADVFDIEQDRGIVEGKLFDVLITVVSTLMVVAYTAISAYLAIATTHGSAFLQRFGVRADVLGAAAYWTARALAFAVIVAMFFALYKFLPNRRIRWRTALLGALSAGLLLELAKAAFAAYIKSFNPGGLYTGTLAVFVIVVFWVYYAACVFILGGEVAQVYELRRTRRTQRAVLED
jgi:membrane protein